ncbi:MAG: hypothetical protein ACLFOY_11470 [Desulfatibacillaceae bacterium]
MEKMRPNQRKLRNFLINKDVQLRLVLHNFIYLFLFVGVTLAVVLSPLIYDMSYAESIDVQYQAAQTLLHLFKLWLPAVVVMALLIFIHQVIVTHRLVGPLVNFSHTFRRVAGGDFTRRSRLRRGDYLKKECREINEMVDQLALFITRVKEGNDDLVEFLGRLSDGGLLQEDEYQEEARHLLAKANEVQASLEVFRVELDEEDGSSKC